MLIKVKRLIERHKLLNHGDNILAACSGGPDSLALVHILYQLRSEYELKLAVAHVNHMFRGAEADADAVCVARFCAKLGLPFYQTAIDVPGYIAMSGYSTQDAARILRYRYLRRAASRLGGAKIATGHHQGDQTETILLNLFRGAGGAGLSGMKPSGDGIIRPLLEVTRGEIDAYCLEQGLVSRVDSSNLKTDYLRNYLRIELIPLIERRFNTNLSETICRTAQLVGDENDFVSEQANLLGAAIVSEKSESIHIECQSFNLLHIALRREIIRQAIEKKRGNLKGITFFHVERLLELAASGKVGNVIELPGNLIVRKGYGTIVLESPLPPSMDEGILPPGIELKVPGITAIPALGLSVSARVFDTRPECDYRASAVFPCNQLVPPLYVRTRQAGDRFWPAGALGSKKLKDFFIDNKIPREKRDRIPLFCDSKGIFWVGGYRRAQRSYSGEGRFLQLDILMGGATVD